MAPETNLVHAIDVRWLFGRIRTLFTRSTNQGLGPFAIFVVFLTIAGISGRLVYTQWDLDRRYMDDLVRTDIEPVAHSSQALILTVIVQALNKELPKLGAGVANELGKHALSADLSCSDNQGGDCHYFEELLSTMADLVALSDSTPNEASRNAELSRLLTTESTRLLFNTILAGPRTFDSLPMEVTPCGDRTLAEKRVSSWGMQKPICELSSRAHTVLVIPQLLSDPIIGTSARALRIQRGLKDSQLFNLAIENDFGSMPPSVPGKRGPQLVSAYFITTDSLLIYWARGEGPNLRSLPTYRQWAARRYIEDMLADRDQTLVNTSSRTYMDFADHGIVQTQCRAIGATLHSGVLCADFALPPEALPTLVAAINSSPIAHADLVSFESNRPVFPAANVDHLKELDWLRAQFSDNFDPDNLHKIVTLPNNDYFVPLASKADKPEFGLLIKIGGVGPLGSRPVLVFVTASSLLSAIVALFVGFKASRAIAKREEVLSRLRSLQKAVVETDASDNLTSGNDRAEEILGLALPPFGIYGKPDTNFWDIVDQTCIIFPKPGVLLRPGCGALEPTDFEVGTETRIRNERNVGAFSSYIVRLKRRNEWLIINASPVFGDEQSSNRRAKTQMKLTNTFGVLERVDTDLAQTLDKLAPKEA